MLPKRVHWMDHASSAPAGIPGLGTSSRDLEQEPTMQIECAELDNGTLFQMARKRLSQGEKIIPTKKIGFCIAMRY
jgi:hypothetical protein